MMDLYVLGGGSVIILLIFAYAKVMRSEAKQSEVVAQAATESAKSEEVVIEQKDKTSNSVIQVRQKLQDEQKVEQAKVDAGVRDAFSGDSF